MIDFTAFSHGQILSKLWLCQNIEPFIKNNSDVAILGSWYNTLGFLLLARNNIEIRSITGIDIDPYAIDIANKINDVWMINNNKVKNIVEDINISQLSNYDVIINCSVEHTYHSVWFNNIKPNTLVCLQTCIVTDEKLLDSWKIVNPVYSLEEFKLKYPLTDLIFANELNIDYKDWGYKRLMLIGHK